MPTPAQNESPLFDLQNDFDAVVTFANRVMIEYASDHGFARTMVFHVQAVNGSIEVYASTTLTLKDLEDLMETPCTDAGDFRKWSDAYNQHHPLTYLHHEFRSNLGDGGFNDYVTLMVGDAVKESCSRVPANQLPTAILVHSAFESAGSYGIEFHPRKDGTSSNS